MWRSNTVLLNNLAGILAIGPAVTALGGLNLCWLGGGFN